jgi:hypothetical protein
MKKLLSLFTFLSVIALPATSAVVSCNNGPKKIDIYNFVQENWNTWDEDWKLVKDHFPQENGSLSANVTDEWFEQTVVPFLTAEFSKALGDTSDELIQHVAISIANIDYLDFNYWMTVPIIKIKSLDDEYCHGEATYALSHGFDFQRIQDYIVNKSEDEALYNQLLNAIDDKTELLKAIADLIYARGGIINTSRLDELITIDSATDILITYKLKGKGDTSFVIALIDKLS